MSFFQLRTLPGYDWPPLADAALAQIWVAQLELGAPSGGPRPRSRRASSSRYGRSWPIASPTCRTTALLSKAGVVPGAIRTLDDFRRVPVLPHCTYQEQNASFAALSLPAGTVATSTRQAPGPAGAVPVLQTNLVHLWWCACYLRDLEWSGINPAGTLAAIRATGHQGKALASLLQGVTQPCWLRELRSLIVSGPAAVMEVQQDPRVQLQWLRRVAPDYLLSYPANLEVLARLVQADGPLPTLKAIQAISETLTDEARAHRERIWRAGQVHLQLCRGRLSRFAVSGGTRAARARRKCAAGGA